MRQAGLTDAEIRAREAEIRANAHETTLRSLKEFFLLSKIAEAEGIKVEDEDLEQEIEAIAARTDESPRRVRARIEKEGLAEALATQILERKAIDRILEYVDVRGRRRSSRSRPSRPSTRPPAPAESREDAAEAEADADGRASRRAATESSRMPSRPSRGSPTPTAGSARGRRTVRSPAATGRAAIPKDRPMHPRPPARSPPTAPALPRLRPAAADDPGRPAPGEPDHLPGGRDQRRRGQPRR